MKLRPLTLAMSLTLATALPHPAAAQLRLPRLIADGMVMQRGARVPVWGWAAPGTEVTVTMEGRSRRATAGADGAWRVVLSPMRAGGPHEITIAAGRQTVRVRDVLVGDVWIASGQSNMEWPVAESNDAEREIAAADDPLIRHFKVPQSFAAAPEADLAGGDWRKADPEHVGQFTAVGYFFARDLRRHVGVPIGIINTSWGGSRIEPWMSAAMLGLDASGEAEIERREREEQAAILARIRARAGGELPTVDAGTADGRAVWADPALDESGWTEIAVPGVWEGAGFQGMDGTAWYRTAFDLTRDEARAGVRLGLGKIDDSDVAWVNGVEVGKTDLAWTLPRVYDVPASALRPGRNVVAVRVQDFQGGGGIHGERDLLFVEAGGRKRPLAGTWKFRVGAVTVGMDGRANQVPTRLYNKMIHPLLGYPIQGVIWYQGESNADPADAAAYRRLFADLITGWRGAWGSGEFPFLWVQLAAFMAPDARPAESGWATLRESQSATLALPKTAQAIAIDVGDAEDVHPRNKQDVGARLALAARRIAYGQRVVHSGPVPRRHEVRGGRVVVHMDAMGGGALVARGAADGTVKGFAIAGADRRWVWADARIEGGRVVVWSDAVPAPVAVRYAWGSNPAGANLYSAAGLPAGPFRTDGW